MKKSLLIGLIVCLLALSGIGAAFANSLSFGSSVGVLATNTQDLPDPASVDGVVWVVEDNCVVGNPDAEPEVYYVKLSFDQYLSLGTEIGVAVLADNDDVLAKYWGPVVDKNGTPIALVKGAYCYVRFLPKPLEVIAIYGIRVTVSQETGP